MATAELEAITGLSSAEAELLLEASGGNLEQAVQLHFESEDQQHTSVQDAAMAAALAADEYGEPAGASDGEGMGDTMGSDPHFGGGMRPAQSPVPPAPPRAPPPSRWRGALQWMQLYVPLFGYFESLGRLIYRTGILGFVGTLLWAPFALIGFGPAARPQAPSAAAQQFEAWFEEAHGTTHPRFFRGSCQQALLRSKTDARFLLAYLHDHSSQECSHFCERILSSAHFQGFVDDNFLLWVGDVALPEGRAVRRALRVTQQPAVVILAHGDLAAGMGGVHAGRDGGDNPVQALGTVQGARALDAESLVASLVQHLERFEPLLVAARAEQNERLNERLLREEQEEEYMRSLAEDEAKERAEEEAREAAEAAALAEAAREAAEAQAVADDEAATAARRVARLAKAATLPPEPPAGEGATRLVIRLPDGRRLDRRFEKIAKLQVAIDYVESEDPDGDDVDLVSNFPRKVFKRDMRGETLESLGLHPAATLFTRELDDDD
jgi:hypothetical protein